MESSNLDVVSGLLHAGNGHDDRQRVLAALMQQCVHARAAWRGALLNLLRQEEQLEQAERAVLTAAGELPSSSCDLDALMDTYERRLITWALSLAAGNQKRAAEALGLRPTTLNEKMKRLGLRADGADRR